ncbi:MAG TPA: ATP-binding protein [Bacteroidetes bacterium]|nr:ATP-binding protein [Bacteroidota bacterium]
MKPNRLTIPSDPKRLVQVDKFAEKITRRLKFSDDQRDDIAISLSEAVNNAIIHGNRADPEKTVTIEILPIEEGLRIIVTDQGEGFNMQQVPDPTSPEHLLAESGRGLLIIHHLMDRVEVKVTKKGTRVEMEKHY